MHLRNCSNSSQSAFTIVEISLVMGVLLSLIAVTFIGVNSYKNGTNRATCIQNIAAAQRAVRSYSNLYEIMPGEKVDNLTEKLFGTGKFLPVMPKCPVTGGYTFADGALGIPELGTAFLQCSAEGHQYLETSDW